MCNTMNIIFNIKNSVVKDFIIPNNGVYSNNKNYNNLTNKCGILAIAYALGKKDDDLMIEFIIDYLGMGKDEILDVNGKHLTKLTELCELLNIQLYFHGVKINKFDTQVHYNHYYSIGPNETSHHKKGHPSKSTTHIDIHIASYGSHFEYMDWNALKDFI